MARAAISDLCWHSAGELVQAVGERSRAYAPRTRALHCTSTKAKRNTDRTPGREGTALHRTRLRRFGSN